MSNAKYRFTLPFTHSHPTVRNVNEVMEEKLTFGQRTADTIAATVGSWPFIISQTVLLIVWIALNITAWIEHWDPYPFILLNLMLSMQAAFTAPLIMMSQNRQSMRDRVAAQLDYEVNRKAEAEIRHLIETHQLHGQALERMQELLTELHARVEKKE